MNVHVFTVPNMFVTSTFGTNAFDNTWYTAPTVDYASSPAAEGFDSVSVQPDGSVC